MFNNNKLIKLRKDCNLSQEQLANKLNVSASAIGMWEQGRRQPDNETLTKMANIFNVSTDYLLDNEISQEFKEQSEENKEILKAVADGLTDPLSKALYSKASELKNDRDKRMVLNVIQGFMDDVDNNEN